MGVKLGLVVSLKGSCTPMTVIGKATKGLFKRTRHYECVWFDVDLELNSYWFPEAALNLQESKLSSAGFMK